MHTITIYTVVLMFCIKLEVMEAEEFCFKKGNNECNNSNEPRYLFYDVNQPEGFNLRRDVYMRLAIFMHKYRHKNWKMVLPPWPHLYHWSTKLIKQDQLPWHNFFDVYSLKQFAPVIEMHEFFSELGNNTEFKIDTVFVLQHYKDAFNKNNWTWSDKWSFEKCNMKPNYEKSGNIFKGWFWGYHNVSAEKVDCVSFQGGAGLLDDVLKLFNGRFVMLDHAEVILHDNFGNKEYWECRQSMRFAEFLIEEAKYFMKFALNVSDNVFGKVARNKSKRIKGGSYLSVHLRRRDFITGRPDEIPTIKDAARQIMEILPSLNLTVVFIATDAPMEEIEELKTFLNGNALVYYKPDHDSLLRYKDGGIAIIEQIICSCGRYFIGSHESTFSFRIQEEREIMGFPENTTFNRLCGSNKNCKQPSKWKIQY